MKAVALAPVEWKALLMTNAARLHEGMSAIDCPDPSQLQHIDQHLDRMKELVLAWHRSQLAVQVANGNGHAEPQAVAEASQPEPVASQPKGKVGWPLGRKRGPRKARMA